MMNNTIADENLLVEDKPDSLLAVKARVRAYNLIEKAVEESGVAVHIAGKPEHNAKYYLVEKVSIEEWLRSTARGDFADEVWEEMTRRMWTCARWAGILSSSKEADELLRAIRLKLESEGLHRLLHPQVALEGVR